VLVLALVPGFGRQGGNLEFFLESGIDLDRCMINAGSDILKAEDPNKALLEMNAMFNGYRSM
jgi:orotidine-5'-phosphate decarboxylase